ncbi:MULTISPECIES: hypothetical protein [Methylobacterium]|uniref:Uncharacterized protein n=2 Tax=Methylobacterium TaxID=407 RepID=A0A0C6EVP5_9HYPH|nr:hypothetical protein [Methylobacterium aquaticum]BAQ44106.1 hypothetical protein Maq22A_c03305 [Methylobacterium aquaticum]
MTWDFEKQKLGIEYFKAAISIVSVATLALGVYQLSSANKSARDALDDKLATEWRDHLFNIYESSELRPFFYEVLKIDKSDINYNKAMALADVRLEIIDNIVNTYDEWPEHEIKTWKNTVSKAFSQSPLLCERYFKTKDNFDAIADELNPACLCRDSKEGSVQCAAP